MDHVLRKNKLVFPTATPGLLAVRCISRKQRRGQTRTTNPHVMNTSWPSWDVISMDVRRDLKMNTKLNKSMGDLYRETMRWIARVTNSGYIISVMWKCEWDNLVKENSEIKEHIESYYLSSPLTPREHYTIHDLGTLLIR